MGSSVLVAAVVVILINAISADNHILAVDHQDVHSNDLKEPFQSHFRRLRTAADPNDVVTGIIQDKEYTTSGNDVSDTEVKMKGQNFQFYVKNKDVAASNNKSHLNTTLVLTDMEGIIETPGYPESYPTFSTLVWTIRLQEGFSVNLRIIDFSAMPDDNLVIFDDVNGNDISALSSDLTLPYYTNVPSNQISLTFTTQQLFFPSRGIYIQYAGQEGTNTNLISIEENEYDWNTLYSPNYPDNYKNNEYLVWIISTPSTSDRIRIEITSLHLESGYDWLLIYNGNDTENQNPMGSLSGSGGSDIEYITTVNSVSIVFKTDATVPDQGFEIIYKTYKAMEGCPYSVIPPITWPEGLVTNLDWPSGQYVPHTCQWLITVAPGKVIDVFLGTYSSGFSLKFYDGSAKNDTILWSSDYKYTHPFEDAIAFQSSSNSMLAVIDRDYYGSARFAFRFQEVNKILQSCDGDTNLSISPGQIKSLMYPRYIPPQTYCRWSIQAPAGYRIMLTIEELSLGYYDSVAFVNENEGSLAEGCGSYKFSSNCSIRQTVFSETNLMLVLSNISSSNSYFKFFYGFFPAQSLAIESDDYSGMAISPNFPNSYPNNYYHIYYIEVAEGSVYLQFDQFSTESCCDFLYVYDGNSTSSKRLASLSGGKNGYQLYSSGRHVTMEFITDGSVTDSGFHMSYNDNSVWYNDQQLTDASSYTYIYASNLRDFDYISPPGAPGYYPNNVDFIWYISCNEGYEVHHTIYRVDIDSSDFLYIFKGLGTNDNPFMVLNGMLYYSELSVPTYALSSTLWFHSDSDYSGLGFYVWYHCV